MNKIPKARPAVLLLSDGTTVKGYMIGKQGATWGEICFNTGMTGYQEIYTDPSYFGQIIVNTFPHIGNYGTLERETESARPMISGLVIKEYSQTYSRFAAAGSLENYLISYGITGIGGIDTRALVRYIRRCGAMNAAIAPTKEEAETLLEKAPAMDGLELASRVSTETVYELGSEQGYRVAVLDLGIKRSILFNLIDRGCRCRVFPAQTPVREMMSFEPQGFFVSNGPGDPAAMPYAIAAVRDMLATRLPLFGICLGHQLLALACGLKTFKMHHGHRGLNHPIKNLISGRCEITSQNHGFSVSPDLKDANYDLIITHLHLNDGSIAGLRLREYPAFSVQYHPEASPGPHDSRYLFDEFLAMITRKN